MKNNRRMISGIIYILLGSVLFALGFAQITDEFWSGMGAALIAIGAVRIMQSYRFRKNETYREKVETEINDERFRFIRNKAWAWSGYLFILIAAVLTIAFKLFGQDLLSMAASFAVCLLLILYWGCYLILCKKY